LRRTGYFCCFRAKGNSKVINKYPDLTVILYADQYHCHTKQTSLTDIANKPKIKLVSTTEPQKNDWGIKNNTENNYP
jgi:hypothetical protein